MPTIYDTIVLGLGAVGSAALYQLARRGVRVLGIDQFSPPHALGSSHGDTRVTRQAIGEGAQYTPLVLRSYEIWRDIEQQTGADLLTITGGLIISHQTGSTMVHGEVTVRTDRDTYRAKHLTRNAHPLFSLHRVLATGSSIPRPLASVWPSWWWMGKARWISAAFHSIGFNKKSFAVRYSFTRLHGAFSFRECDESWKRPISRAVIKKLPWHNFCLSPEVDKRRLHETSTSTDTTVRGLVGCRHGGRRVGPCASGIGVRHYFKNRRC